MKLRLVTALVALIAGGAQASEYGYDYEYTNPWTTQFDLGYSELTFSRGDFERTEDGVGAKVLFSKELPSNFRYGFDYSYFGDLTNVERYQAYNTFYRRDVDVRDEFNLAVHSVGVNVFYDFKNQSKLTPYVGVRGGVNLLKYDEERCVTVWSGNSGCTELYSDSETKAGVGGVLGVAYRTSPTMQWTVSGEYNYIGKIEEIKVDQYGINLGARMSF